ncbi:MAG TPA: ferredoxin [Actinospica sp.]|nr:ferredoxin [Actinospica sp.]
MGMKVTIDQDKCCGAGQCVVLAPDVFDQREQDAVVVLLDETPAAPLHGDVREAASVCPAAAITVQED